MNYAVCGTISIIGGQMNIQDSDGFVQSSTRDRLDQMVDLVNIIVNPVHKLL